MRHIWWVSGGIPLCTISRVQSQLSILNLFSRARRTLLHDVTFATAAFLPVRVWCALASRDNIKHSKGAHTTYKTSYYTHTHTPHGGEINNTHKIENTSYGGNKIEACRRELVRRAHSSYQNKTLQHGTETTFTATPNGTAFTR